MSYAQALNMPKKRRNGFSRFQVLWNKNSRHGLHIELVFFFIA